jgi:hypothetical protein
MRGILMEEYINSFMDDVESFAQLVGEIPFEELNYKPTATSWNIIEIIVHVVDCEIVFQQRIKAILAEDNPLVTAFDQNAWATRLQYSVRVLKDQLALYVLLRKVFVPILQNMKVEDGERVGRHSVIGEVKVKDILKKMSTHLQGHIGQIERNRIAYASQK